MDGETTKEHLLDWVPCKINFLLLFSSLEPKAQFESLWSLLVRRRPLNDFFFWNPGPVFFKLLVDPLLKWDWNFVQMDTVRKDSRHTRIW